MSYRRAFTTIRTQMDSPAAQARFERYFWISLLSVACAIILCVFAGCGGSDGNDQKKDPTLSVCDENDPNFVGPCELNPPSN